MGSVDHFRSAHAGHPPDGGAVASRDIDGERVVHGVGHNVGVPTGEVLGQHDLDRRADETNEAAAQVFNHAGEMIARRTDTVVVRGEQDVERPGTVRGHFHALSGSVEKQLVGHQSGGAGAQDVKRGLRIAVRDKLSAGISLLAVADSLSLKPAGNRGELRVGLNGVLVTTPDGGAGRIAADDVHRASGDGGLKGIGSNEVRRASADRGLIGVRSDDIVRSAGNGGLIGAGSDAVKNAATNGGLDGAQLDHLVVAATDGGTAGAVLNLIGDPGDGGPVSVAANAVAVPARDGGPVSVGTDGVLVAAADGGQIGVGTDDV